MSDDRQIATEAQAEGGDTEREAIWADLASQDAQAAGTASPDETDKGAATGQGEIATPSSEDAGSPPASETPDDLWKNATPAQRAAYEAAEAKAKQAESVARSHGGRLSQAYVELDELRSRLEADRNEAGATPKGEEAKDREERLEQLREEYPDVAGPILDMLAAQEATIRGLVEAQTAQAGQRTEAAIAEQYEVLASVHKDWRETVNSEEFGNWVQSKPGFITDTIQRNGRQIIDGASCAEIITLFKSETGRQSPAAERLRSRREEQLDALAGVDGVRPTTTATGSDDVDGIWRELADADRRKAATMAANRR